MKAQQDKTDQANTLIDKVLANVSTAYHLKSKLTSTDPYDLDDYADEITDWLNGEGYLTDWDAFSEQFKLREKSDLRFWKGTYYLATDDLHIYRMKITDRTPKGKEETNPQIGVYLNGVLISDFDFSDKVLSWDNSASNSIFTKGKLVFTNLIDHLGNKKGAYSGNYCEGSVLRKPTDAPIALVGKVNVNSYEALKGGYGATDELNYWAGTYAVYSDVEGLDTFQGNLVITNAADDADNKITFNDTPVKQFSYSNGQLTWPGKVNNKVVNDNSGKFRFTRTADRKKVIGGIFHPPQGKGFLTTGAYQTEKAGNDSTELQIINTALRSRPAGEPYNFRLKAQGGLKPYSWEISGLPEGFDQPDGSGLVSGTPQKAGLYSVAATVTDTSAATTEAYFDLEILEGKEQNPVAGVSSISSIITGIIASLIAIAGVIITIHNKKAAKDLDAKKRREAETDLADKIAREDALLKAQNEREDKKEKEALAREQAKEEAARKTEEERSKREQIITEELRQIKESYDRLQKELETARREADEKLEERIKDAIEANERKRESQERVAESSEGGKQEEESDGREETSVERVEHHQK